MSPRQALAALLTVLAGVPAPQSGAMVDATGITGPALRAYTHAAEVTGAPWQLLAAIGHHESGDGTTGGRVLLDNGRSNLPIYGPELGGPEYTGEFAYIPDSDGGELDGRPGWDRAVGPMQFLPSTWLQWAADGDGDGTMDPQDLDDAAVAAGHMLASNGDLTDPAVLHRAIRSYNNSAEYEAAILERMARYTDQWAAAPTTPRREGGLWLQLKGPVDRTGWQWAQDAWRDVADELGITYQAAGAAPSGAAGDVSTSTGDGMVDVQGITVAPAMAGPLRQLLEDMDRQGYQLTGWGHRDAAEQIQLRRQNCGSSDWAIHHMPVMQCSPPTALPGTSMHELGLAVDFRLVLDDGTTVPIADDPQAVAVLHARAARFNILFTVPGEPWHGSLGGS